MSRRAIYEGAAERISEYRDCYCCFALLRSGGRLEAQIAAARAFREVFGLFDGETFEMLARREGWNDRDATWFNRKDRILALCLAYSVLTYGRPKSRSRKRRFSKIKR